MELPEGWEAVSEADSHDLDFELRRELPRRHQLYGRDVHAIARRPSTYDALFLEGDGPTVYWVHLDPNAQKSKRLPYTRVYRDLADFHQRWHEVSEDRIEFPIFQRVLLGAVTLGIAATLSLFIVVYTQGSREPDTTGEYVALGSSYASGMGLGRRAPGSPFACLRTDGGYPTRVAAHTGLRLVDQTCAGATAHQVMHGGQYFQGPQLDAVGPQARLVTITVGGNDVDFVRDLMLASGTGISARLRGPFWEGPAPVLERGYRKMGLAFQAMLPEIARRAPDARVVVVTYPRVLPSQGTCDALGLSADHAERLREVEASLAEETRILATDAGVAIIDMHRLSEGHDACSTEPWTSGARTASGAPFHPTPAGVEAMAAAIIELRDAEQ